MEDVEKQFQAMLPQNSPASALSMLEVRAYEAFVRSIALGHPYGFVVSGKMTTSDIIDELGYAVIQGDPGRVYGIGQWLVLTDQEKVRLREKLEMDYSHVVGRV